MVKQSIYHSIFQNGLNALHLSAIEGHASVVAGLLSRGAKVNAATNKGNTALHLASLSGKVIKKGFWQKVLFL